MIGRRWVTAVAAVAAAGAVAAGCSPPPEPYTVPPSDVYSAPPLPAGAVLLSSTPLPAPVGCGDPAASLRPFPPGANPSGPNLDEIRARGRLIVGLDTGSNLMSFRNPATGRIEGFDVDIAREIARDLFGSPDRIEFRVLAYSEREKALQDSQVDIVAKTMTVTCDRRAQIDFSSVYYVAHQKLMVTAGSPINSAADLAGKRVCAAEGTTSLDRLRLQQPAAAVVTVPMWSDCLVMLQQRQVDAISTDDTLLAGMATQDPHVRIVGPNMGDELYGIGIRTGDDDLERFVNGTLERIRRDGTWERIYDSWLSVLGPSPGPPPATYRD